MTKQDQIHKCSICGNITEVLHESTGILSCCRESMVLLEENTIDAAVEKHVPVVERIDGGYRVIVGEVNHPMIDKHYIEWIELLTDNHVFRRYLKPGEAPEVIFHTNATDVVARGYCNLHGNWRSN